MWILEGRTRGHGLALGGAVPPMGKSLPRIPTSKYARSRGVRPGTARAYEAHGTGKEGSVRPTRPAWPRSLTSRRSGFRIEAPRSSAPRARTVRAEGPPWRTPSGVPRVISHHLHRRRAGGLAPIRWLRSAHVLRFGGWARSLRRARRAMEPDRMRGLRGCLHPGRHRTATGSTFGKNAPQPLASTLVEALVDAVVDLGRQQGRRARGPRLGPGCGMCEPTSWCACVQRRGRSVFGSAAGDTRRVYAMGGGHSGWSK